jgi:hypothetical protein
MVCANTGDICSRHRVKLHGFKSRLATIYRMIKTPFVLFQSSGGMDSMHKAGLMTAVDHMHSDCFGPQSVQPRVDVGYTQIPLLL